MFDHIDGFEFSLIFWIQILSYLPLLQEGTTAKLLALRKSQNRPCYKIQVTVQHVCCLYVFAVVVLHNMLW